jgi:hypothetical protein
LKKSAQNSKFHKFPAMTNRSRGNGKTEVLIETCRSEARWLKVIDLAEDLLRLDSTSNRKRHQIYYGLFQGKIALHNTCFPDFQDVWPIS